MTRSYFMKKTFGPIAIIFFCSFLNALCLFGNDLTSQATSAERRLNSWEQRLKLKNESIFKNLQWKALGPKSQGGRIETIDCPPGYSTTIYVGVGSGNIWKTINNGTTWEPIFENEFTFTIGDIAISKSNPDVIWVGTGENLMARSSFAGMGVFKSPDGGKTWQNMGLQDTHHIGRIVVDSQNPDIVYMAALGHNYTFNQERGLFKTSDGGKTWSKSLYISEKVGVVDVAIDPSDNNILYAAAWERDRKAWNNVVCGEGSGVYRTTDAGMSWKKLSKGLPSGKYIGRIGLDVSVSNPKVVYAIVDNQTPVPVPKGKEKEQGKTIVGGEVYRSDDRGDTWRKVNQDDFQAGINYSFGDIRVSPENENIIYVLGVNLVMSTDGGKTYKKLGGTVVHLYPHPTRTLHLDQHDLWIDPLNPERLILGNDGGLFLSNDKGKTWLHLNNLPIGEFYAISVDMGSPFKIYGGTQDNAALCGPSSQALEEGIEDHWKNVWIDLWGGGDSYFTLVDPTNPDVIYYEQQFGELNRKDMKTGLAKFIQPKAKEGEPALRYNWMTPYIISPHNPFTIYYGANKMFKSLNRGDNWTCISPDLTTNPGKKKQGNVPYGTITTISESPLKAGLIYIGTDDGNVYVTQNDGVSWTKINQGLASKWVSRVVSSSHELGRIYVSLTGYREDDFETYLYVSNDFGNTWQPISSNLPAESVNVIREDPKNKNILYIGTDQGGVYVSLDSGKTWISLCNNLPTAAVHDIAVHPREGELVIGTHGRSVFLLDVSPIQNFTAAIAEKDAHLFEIRPAILPHSRDYKGDWAWETRKSAVIHYYLKSPCEVQISILDKDGKLIKKLDGTHDAGINVAVWDLSVEKKEATKSIYEPGLELAEPGNYQVEIQAGEILLKGQIQVNAGPRS